LNGRSPKFLYEVIFRTPKLIVRNESIRIEFENQILIEWYDMRITYEKFWQEQEEVLKT
jgi:chloramphenicol O-acetyltransferase